MHKPHTRSSKPELADFDVFERDGARPADIVGREAAGSPAVTLCELFGDQAKLSPRFQADLEALREASAFKGTVALEAVALEEI